MPLSNGRRINFLVYMSARNTIPEYSDIGRTLGQLIGLNGHNYCWGGGDGGLMGLTSASVFETAQFGLDQTIIYGVPNNALKAGEGAKTKNAVFYKPKDNFFDRIEEMQSTADAIIMEPGGYGSIQEVMRGLRAIEAGRIPAIPVIIINPKIPGTDKGLYDEFIAHIRLLVERGYMRPEVLQNLHVVEDAAQAYAVVEKHYTQMSEAVWQKQKREQLVYHSPKNAVMYLAQSNNAVQLSHYAPLLLPKKDLVSVFGNSNGRSELNPDNRSAYDLAKAFVEMVARSNKKIICTNSTRGINGHIFEEAARYKAVELATCTASCYTDGRVRFSSLVNNAIFSSDERRTGFMKRRANILACFPGADSSLADILCEISVDSPKLQGVEVFVFSPNGEFDHIFRQSDVINQSRFAVGRDGNLIGLGSPGVANQVHIIRTNEEMVAAYQGTLLGQTRRTLEKQHNTAIAKTEETHALELPHTQEASAILLQAMNGIEHAPHGERGRRRRHIIDEAVQRSIAAQKERLLHR